MPNLPATPSVPFLMGVDDVARGVDFLLVDWHPVDEAELYDVSFAWSSGEEIRPDLTTGGRFSALLPNRNYAIRVRARNTIGSSEWSAPLQTCTRLPIPSPPSTSTSMIQTNIDLFWALILSGVDHTDPIYTQLGRVEADNTIDVIGQSLPLQGHYTDMTPAYANYYMLRLISVKTVLPTGLNISAWSNTVLVIKGLFAKMQLPVPSLLESHHLSIDMLRRHYGL